MAPIAKKKLIKKNAILRVKDIGVPTDYDMFRDGITQSMLSTFQQCRQKFIFTTNRWTREVGNKSTQFGSLFHEMLDKAYHQPKPPTFKQIGRWIDQYMEERTEEFIGQDQMVLDRMVALCHVILDEYIKFYPEDWTKKKFTAVEQAFRITWRGFTLRGKKDGRYDDKAGYHWLMEHKTKSQIDDEYLMLALSFDLQNLFYITAEEEEFNIEMKGCLYNVVRNPGTKPRNMEGADAFAARVRKEIQKKPAHYFKRYEVFYSKAEKEDFKRQLEMKLKDVKALLSGKLGIYKNESACHKPFKCGFLEACASGTMVGYRQKEHLFEELVEPAVKA